MTNNTKKILSPYCFDGWSYSAYRFLLSKREDYNEEVQFGIFRRGTYCYYNQFFLGRNFEESLKKLDKILIDRGYLLLNEEEYERYKILL